MGERFTVISKAGEGNNNTAKEEKPRFTVISKAKQDVGNSDTSKKNLFQQAVGDNTQKYTIEHDVIKGKLKRGEGLTSAERKIVNDFGVKEFISGDTELLFGINAQRNSDKTKKIIDKKNSGKKLTSSEEDILETAKLVNFAAMDINKDMVKLTDNPNTNKQNQNLLKAQTLYKNTAYTPDNVKIGEKEIKLPNNASSFEKKIIQSGNKLDLYLGSGIEQYASGIGTTIDLIAGKSNKEIADRNSGAYTIAGSVLSKHYTETGKDFDKAIQDIVTNIAQNAIPMAAGMGLGAVGVSSTAANIISQAGTFAPSIFGNAYKEGLDLGVTDTSKLLTYAFTTTAAETTLGIALNNMPGLKGVISKNAAVNLTKNIINPIASWAIKTAIGGGGEFLEESIQEILSPLMQKYILGADVDTIISDPLGQLSNAAYAGFIGFASSVLMSGGMDAISAKTESNLKKYGQHYLDILGKNNIDIKNIATYITEITEKETTANKTAELVKNGDTSAYSVGVMVNEVAQLSDNGMKTMYEAVGREITKNPQELQELISGYKSLVEDGYIFPEKVDVLFEQVKGEFETKESVSDSLVGEFAINVQIYSPRALIMGQAVKNIDSTVRTNEITNLKDDENTSSAMSENNTEQGEDGGLDEIREQTGFTEPSDREIYEPPTKQEELDALLGKPKNAKQRHIEKVSDKFGIKIIWSDEVSRGKYVPSTKSIVLNPNIRTAEMYNFVFKHEFTHYLEGKQGYTDFKNYVFKKSALFEKWVRERLDKNGIDSTGSREKIIKRLTQIQYEAYKNSDEMSKVMRDRFTMNDAEEEVLADFVGERLLGTGGQLEETLDMLSDLNRKHRGIFQKIRDFVRDMINRFKGDKTFKGLVSDLEYLNERLKRVAESDNKKISDNETEKYSIEYDNIKYSQREKFIEYNKPITIEDIKLLRNIGRKSINEFTTDEIEVAQKWAYKLYQQLGTKSPFFRRWFGDWRAYDNTPVDHVDTLKDNRGKVTNKDTGWIIQTSKKVHKETSNHRAKAEKNAVKYLPYIDDITEKAVLFDSVVSDNDNENSMFFHTLYAYTEVLGYPALLKLRVEELYYHGNSGTGTLRRNYILQNIEEELVSESNRLSRPNHLETNSSISSISDLFKLVKNYDAEFKPKPVNEALIENGKPKVFYHGTASKFFEFDKNMGGINTNAQSAKKAFFFTSSQKVAGGYAEDARPKEIMALYNKAERLDNRAPFTGEYDAAEQAWRAYEEAELAYTGNGYIMSVYICLNNPFVYDFEGNEYRERTYNDIIMQAKNNGHDGVIFKNTFDASNQKTDEMTDVVAVFSPTSIKSAEDGGNIGTFSEAETDIRHSIAVLSADELLDKYDQGEITREEYLKQTDSMTRRAALQYVQEWERENGAILSSKNRLEAEREKAVELEREEQQMRKDRESNIWAIRRTVRKLDRALRTNTNSKHIPEAYKNVVSGFCKLFVDNDKATFEHKDLADIYSYYVKMKGNGDTIPDAPQYDPFIDELLKSLIDTLSGRKLTELNNLELNYIRMVTDALNYTVDHEAQVFIDGKKAKYEEVGRAALNDIENAKPSKLTGALKKESAEQFREFFLEGNMLPEYFLKRIGGTFEKTFKGLMNGVNKWARNMEISSKFVDDVKSKYDYDEWKDTTVNFKTESGVNVEITIDQAMQLIATAQRERSNNGQKAKHLSIGGVVIDTEAINNAMKKQGKSKEDISAARESLSNRAIQITFEDADIISKMLTDAQKGYIKEIVDFLSTQCAAWGNEVTMEQYGYRQFNESNYFPYISSELFLAKDPAKAESTILRRASFTHSLQKNANNPLVLTSFTEIALQHIESMCNFNAMTVPLETLNKIFNYKTEADENIAARSVKAELKNAFGSGAVDYVQNLINDLNKGVRGDQRDSFLNKMTSLFKKNAVLANLSVIFQQPTAIIRACSDMKVKYFAKASKYHSKNNYEECKQYAPVAIIKQMGRFDTGIGVKNTAWLSGEQTLKEKADDFLGWGAGKADEIAWSFLWSSVKAEIADTTDLKVGSEEFLTKAGERFTELVNKTQVYDSVLTKSQNMRNKGLVGSITSFMSESTVALNMVVNSFLDFKEGKISGKKFSRIIMSVATAEIVTAMMQSIITAARDDDEDKSYFEKYLKNVVSNSLSNFNLAGKIPYIRDVISIWEGYDVERGDIKAVSDLIKAFQTVMDENKSWDEKVRRISEALAALYGVPLKNINRDIEAIVKTIYGFAFGEEKTDVAGLEFAIGEGLGIIKNTSDKYSALAKAGENGNEEKYDRMYDNLLESGKDEGDIKSGIKNYYRTNKDVKKEGNKLFSDLEDNKTFKSLKKEDKSQLEKDIISSLATEKTVSAMVREPDVFDELYEALRNNKNLYNQKKKELMASGMSESLIDDGIEAARISYMKSIGIDVNEYLLYKIATSKKYADTNNSGGVSKSEKTAAINKMDLDENAKRFFNGSYK